MLQWFDGNVLCNESKVYIDHFLAVTRARPFDDEQGEHSDDNFSDKELCFDKKNFSQVLKTLMDLRRVKNHDSSEVAGAAENVDAVQAAFDKAEQLWPVPDRSEGLKQSGVSTLSAEEVDSALAAAKASQKREVDGLGGPESSTQSSAAPSIRKGKAFTAEDVWAWFQSRSREGTLRQKQFEMLRVIRQRVCDELAEAGDGVCRSPPLMHLLHGGPGTGKSEVLKVCRHCFRKFVVGSKVWIFKC